MPVVLLLLLLLSSTSHAQPEPRRSVLLLLPDPPGRPNSNDVLEGVQNTLRAADPSIAFSADYLSQLDTSRAELAEGQIAWFREKYRNRGFDVIIVLGPETLRSLMRFRDELWPGIPVVYCGSGGGRIDTILKRPDVTGALLPAELRNNLQIMSRLLPQTRHVALVGGSSPVDIDNNSRVFPVIREAFPNAGIIDLTRLRIAELQQRLRAVPPETFIVIANFFFDPDGHPVFRRELVAALAPFAGGPLFSAGDIAMGAGIVGGDLTHFSRVGAHAAEQALDVMRGVKPADIPVEIYHSASLQFDWRELERWHIPLDRLPPGSEVLYRPFSVWEQYKWTIVIAVAALFVQSLLLAGLLVQRRRAQEIEAARRSAEIETAAARDQISHLNRTASLGELAASIAHEINQPLAGVLSNAQAARRFLDGPAPDFVEVRDALSDICDDATRAGEIVHGMRRMLRKQRLPAEPADLNTLVRDALALLRSDASLRHVALEFDAAPALITVFADAVQLRQVILNLVLNAMEAIGGPGRVVVRTRVAGDRRSAEILVSDSGPGVPPGLASGIFQPFFSTKKEGLGLGLSISASIVKAHGGTLALSPPASPGLSGATMSVTLPAVEAATGAAPASVSAAAAGGGK